MDKLSKSSNLYSACSVILLVYFFLLTQCGHSLGQTCNPNDKKVLLAIKSHFDNSPDLFSTWNTSTNCCDQWNGVLCDDSTTPGRVTFLSLSSSNRISGEIPAIVGDLSFLQTFDLFELPNLTGSIPASISKLSNLQELTIGVTSVSGTIPEFLGHMKSLVKIQLFQNRLTGTIPSSLSLLSNIFQLDLDNNLLSGTIPDIFGSFKRSLTVSLNANNLSGPIPKSLGKANLQTIDLSNNQLEGDASFLFGKDKPITEIRLRMNHLKFNFTNVQIPLGLQILDISFNDIFGALPRQLGQLRQLMEFNASNNQLCGKVPKGRRFKNFGPSAFAHNKCLCDAPGLPACNP